MIGFGACRKEQPPNRIIRIPPSSGYQAKRRILTYVDALFQGAYARAAVGSLSEGHNPRQEPPDTLNPKSKPCLFFFILGGGGGGGVGRTTPPNPHRKYTIIRMEPKQGVYTRIPFPQTLYSIAGIRQATGAIQRPLEGGTPSGRPTVSVKSSGSNLILSSGKGQKP